MVVRTFIAGGLCVLKICLLGSIVIQAALAGEPWVRIEEDWELILNEPDSESHSPQITIYLTPDKEDVSTYFQIQLNHAADADFSGGGFRVAALANDQSIDEVRSTTRTPLQVAGDKIRWTNVMAKRDSMWLYAIKDGDSQTWGQFGGPRFLLQIPANHDANLSNYTPYMSAKDVDMGFGRNRVASLKLKTVRAYRDDGTVETVPIDLEVK